MIYRIEISFGENEQENKEFITHLQTPELKTITKKKESISSTELQFAKEFFKSQINPLTDILFSEVRKPGNE